MFQNVLQCDSVRGILPQEPCHQVPGLTGDVRGEPEVDAADPLVGVRVGLSLEWWLAHQELVGEDTEGPVVDSLVVGVAVDHLGWEVVQGPAHRGSPENISSLVAFCDAEYFTVVTVFILITHIVLLYNISILLSLNLNN